MTGVAVAVADMNPAEFVEVRQRSVPKNGPRLPCTGDLFTTCVQPSITFALRPTLDTFDSADNLNFAICLALI